MTEPDVKRRGRDIQELLRQGRWSDAIPLLDEWIRIFPRHAPGWFWKAGCLERLGELHAAVDCARRAHDLAPAEPKVTELLDRLEQQMDRERTSRHRAPQAPSAAQQPQPSAGSAAPGPPAAPEATLAEEGASAAGRGMDDTLLEEEQDLLPPEPTLVEQAPAAAAAVEVEATIAEPEAAAAPPATQVASVPPATVAEGRDGPGPVGDSPAATAAAIAEDPAAVSAAAPRTEVEPRPRVRLPETPVEEWREGSVAEGRYEIRGMARGGMGVVYFAFDRELGLDMAIKTPLPAALATESGRVRFFREAEAWIALGLHPNICAAYYVREIGGVPRMFIEYIDGGSLADRLASGGAVSIADGLDLAIQVAAGVDHAHTFSWRDEEGREHRGVVHRDLKPANVLVAGDGTARVTDFGLVGRGGAEAPEDPAAAVGEVNTRPADDAVEPTLVEAMASGDHTGTAWGTVTIGGTAMGTPPYMAPEQWHGAHLAGPPADAYAFGCILYELLCGRRPFVVDSKYARATAAVQRVIWERMHREQPPPDPRDLNPQLDEDLARLMLACLAKAPEQRPGSFAELGAALREIHLRMLGREYPRPLPGASELMADSLNNRGVSFASLEQPRRAERAWREALETDPHHVQAAFNLALLEWRHHGATDLDVVNRMNEAVAATEVGWRGQLLAGRLDLSLGRHQAAVERLRAALNASNHAPQVVRDYAMALCAAATESGDGELWREAAELLRRAGGALRNDPVVLTCYALAMHRLGEEETSRRLWSDARQRLQDPPDELQRGVERLIPGGQLIRRPGAFLGRLHTVAVSHDGRTGLSGGDQGALGVWDLRSGELLRNLRGSQHRIRSLAVIPHQPLALASSETDAVAVWDLTTGAIVRTLQVHSGYLNALVCSDDGRWAAAAGSAGALFIWDLATSRRRTAHKAHERYAASVALSADGALAAIGAGNGTVCVYDPARKRNLASFEAHTEAVSALALGTDGRRLLSGGEDGLARLWDLRHGDCIVALEGHGGPIRSVALAPDGRRALTASADGSLRLWAIPEGRPINVLRIDDSVQAAAVSPDWGAALVAHGANLTQLSLRETLVYRPAWAVSFVVTASEADERAREFRSHLEHGRRLAREQDFETALVMLERARSVSGYERARDALDLSAQLASLFPRKGLNGAWEERVIQGHEGAVTAAALSRLGSHALSAGRDRRVVLWDWRTGAAKETIDSRSVTAAACFLGDGNEAATAGLDNVIRLWDLETGGCFRELTGHEARIHALATDPLGRFILSASADRTARLWDAASGECVHEMHGHMGQALAATVSPDARFAATGGDDGSLLLWDLRAGHCAGELSGHGGAVRDLAWSADGRFILSAADDHTVKLWEVRSGRGVRTLDEGVSSPTRVALSPDGRFALVGDEAGKLGVWELRARRCLRVFEGHTAAVSAVALTRDGQRALSASEDGALRLWYLDWEAEIRPFAVWDEGVLPYLQVFLSLHVPLQGSGRLRPEWTEDDARRLLSDLRHRGFGWVRPDGVRDRLRELAEDWKGPPKPTPRPADGRRRRLAATPQSRARSRTRRRQLLLAAAIVVPLVLAVSHLLSLRELRFDSLEVRERRRRDMTAIVMPAQMARLGRDVTCDPKQLAAYLYDYTHFTDRPRDWAVANHCLEVLGDPRVVAPLLDMVRAQEPLPRTTQIGSDRRQVLAAVRKAMSGGLDTPRAVQSMLARLGERAIPELVEGLGDREEEVRSTAAGALALRASEQSIEVLLAHLRHPRAEVRRAVSGKLQSIACSRRLSRHEAFAVVEELAADGDPEVRLNVVRGLTIFAGAKPRHLAERLAKDADPEVSEAARKLLDTW